ncbi:hypothetical protein CASFOL_036079 [Castilleja foliolosa]|uniref:Alpha/beta hydrolase fold-3 domain-containing protein n=1 Tax=Castilleja foliolosa TaxID=1961234 RepID=A0ABD3BWY5_9LAMI
MITMSVTKTIIQKYFFLIIFHLLSLTIATNSSSPVAYEIYPFVRVYKNGTVERLQGTNIVPASLDPETKILSKDTYISPKLNNIPARLYRPEHVTVKHKLPLLVYFHGGAFFTESAFSPTYHNHLNTLVAKANIIAVSVNYRLAPENPLPICYQDSWLALKWVFSHSKGDNGNETWLKKYVDFEQVYLGGDGAGGNIAHNVAIRAGLDGIGLNGMFLNCPFFWGESPIGNESKNPIKETWVESIWVHAYPNSTGFDDPLLNPGLDPNLSELGCKRVLVYVAEKDILRDRGWYYGHALNESTWHEGVKVVDMKGEDHVFNLVSPEKPDAKFMLEQLASFLNQREVGDGNYGMNPHWPTPVPRPITVSGTGGYGYHSDDWIRRAFLFLYFICLISVLYI